MKEKQEEIIASGTTAKEASLVKTRGDLTQRSEVKQDPAQNGGIDMDSSMIAMKVDKSHGGLQVPVVDAAALGRFKDMEFTPRIIQSTAYLNALSLIGLKE